MNFSKMHGLGNDFIVVWSEQGLPRNATELAIRACDRNFGIGADGLVFIVPSDKADCMMRIINSDGSEAEQCGNAIRCVAKFVYDHGYIRKTELAVETIGAGAQTVVLTLKQEKVDQVRVDMGAPILEGLKVPTTLDQSRVVLEPIEAGGREYLFTAVSMGNPHCVIEVDDAPSVDLHAWGAPLETHPMFPRKANIEFITVRSRQLIDMRVWERGAGVTLACGTGACAALVAAHLAGKSDRSATVRLSGGDLQIDWDEQNDHVYMTGPAEEVFRGRWLL